MSSKASRLDYLARFLDAVDAAQSGRYGAICEDKWLQWNHRPEFIDIVARHLDHGSSRVRAESIILLTRVGDSSQAEKVSRMRRNDVDPVAAAAVGYLSASESRRALAEELLQELRVGYGEAFREAARALEPLADKEDLPTLRQVLGEVDEERRAMVRRVLAAVVDRNPELEDARDGVLSPPSPPDAAAYNAFLDKSFDYLDRRYRENIHPHPAISPVARANVEKALRAIASRHHAESWNIARYSDDLGYEHEALGELLAWARDDLDSKEQKGHVAKVDPQCRSCGSPMRRFREQWYCPECASRRD